MTVLTDVRTDWNDLLGPSRLFDEGGLWITGLPIVDTFEGEVIDPQSLHKYLYCHADPVNRTDPTGRVLPHRTRHKHGHRWSSWWNHVWGDHSDRWRGLE